MIPFPDSWREANPHLRQALLAEAAARQFAAMQDGDGARRKLTLAAMHAVRDRGAAGPGGGDGGRERRYGSLNHEGGHEMSVFDTTTRRIFCTDKCHWGLGLAEVAALH